jgi:hypothetical protein
VSTTIQTPDRDESCAYCDCRIFDHDPICVRDCTAGCGSPAFFCNHACLTAHVETEGLTEGGGLSVAPRGVTAVGWRPSP